MRSIYYLMRPITHPPMHLLTHSLTHSECNLHAVSHILAFSSISSPNHCIFNFADYRLVIICSREEDSNCHLVQNLHAYLRSTPAVKNVEQYLKMKYCNPKHSQLGAPAPAPAPLANCAGWTADIQKYVQSID